METNEMERIQIDLHRASANQNSKGVSHPVRMAEVNKHMWIGMGGLCTVCGNMEIPVKIKIQLLYNPAILFLHTHPIICLL